jgi:ABC-type transport system involved in multi-copper enzyme maturation permease subunit
MKNFGILLLHELHLQMKSFIFVVMIPVALAVGLLVTNLQVTSYKDRMQVYLEQQKQSNEQLENIHYYSQFNIDVYMPPSLLSVFAKGVDESIGNKITVSVIDMPELSVTSQRSNAFIKIFNNMDISDVVKIMSIFMVLMAACPIAMDRERQTGKLTFANSVGRLEYYLSKYLALMLVACIMVAVIFIAPAIWMTFDTQIDLSLSSLASILWMMIVSLLYLSIFVLVSLVLSSMSSKVSIATLLSLIVWVVLAFIYPFTVNSMIDRLVKTPSENVVNEQIIQIDNEIGTEIYQFQKEHNSLSINGFCGVGMSRSGIVNYCNVTTKDCFESYQLLHDFALPKWWNRNERVYALRENQKTKQLYKRNLYERFAFFIPDNIYQNVCEQIAHTDYDFRGSQFIDASRNYRNELISYVRSKKGFGYTFFTQMPESEMRNTYEEYSQVVMDKYCNNQNLDKIFTAEVPRFTFFHQTKTAAKGLLLLLLLNLILGGLSIQLYNKFLSFK